MSPTESPGTTTLRHRTVLLDEAVDALVWRPDGAYVDGTFGRGGHSRAVLALVVEVARHFASTAAGQRGRADRADARAEAPVRLGGDWADHGGVLGRVVRAEVRTQLGHHRFIQRRVAGRREVREHVEHRGVLATEGHATQRIALQTHECLTTEEAAALLRLAIVKAKAAFQHEQCLQAAAQIFGATQAPTRAGQAAAARQTNTAAAARRRLRNAAGVRGAQARCQVVRVFDRQVHDTIKGHARLRICRSGKRAHRGKREKRLFHAG